MTRGHTVTTREPTEKDTTTPTQLLDDYAATSDRYDEIAPKAFAAIRAVIALHRQAERNARADLPGGQCPFCYMGEPTRVMHSFVVDGETHQVHTHTTRAKRCQNCLQPWPCATLQAISDALQGVAD